MDGEQVIKLIDAGFTAEEIRTMLAGTEGNAGAGAAEETKAGGSNETKEQKAEVGGTAPESEVNKDLTKAVADIQASLKAIQEQNLKNAKTEGSGKSDINAVMKSFLDTL